MRPSYPFGVVILLFNLTTPSVAIAVGAGASAGASAGSGTRSYYCSENSTFRDKDIMLVLQTIFTAQNAVFQNCEGVPVCRKTIRKKNFKIALYQGKYFKKPGNRGTLFVTNIKAVQLYKVIRGSFWAVARCEASECVFEGIFRKHRSGYDNLCSLREKNLPSLIYRSPTL
ncbi:CSEP0209 putative effector protein [Blumeria hordei DH14]|uniref:CSEP0209 putative effector protein n=1 Tax=Blumeria graminis f. sp. hordei (strain DH14) TaxID=546991 RepID=N1JIG4_BLUG1|nr:CSEP0209 putative effector protein [Blumeria hordei DH14]